MVVRFVWDPCARCAVVPCPEVCECVPVSFQLIVVIASVIGSKTPGEPGQHTRLCVRSHTDTHSHSHTHTCTPWRVPRGGGLEQGRGQAHILGHMVSLKLMGAARSMVVASARTTAAEIAARWCARKVRESAGGGPREAIPGGIMCVMGSERVNIRTPYCSTADCVCVSITHSLTHSNIASVNVQCRV